MLSSYPNMRFEIMDAIHLMYEDYPEVEIDCLLYLSHPECVKELSNMAIDALKEKQRCSHCGGFLETIHYQEPHSELDGCPMEDMTEQYCPNCDIRGDNID